FISWIASKGRVRARRRLCVRLPQRTESGAGRALQEPDREGSAGQRVPPWAGDKTSIIRQRCVACGFESSCLTEPRLQKSDGVFWLHRRTTPVCVFRRTTRKPFPRQVWFGCGCAPPWSGEPGQMKAMVLAAGLGTRLRPLTDTRPKALVQIGGRTLLEITLSRLRSFGIHDAIINVHHFADMIVEYLRIKSNFGLRVEVSREEVLLDTGGGLKKAGWFFADSPEPFVLHNVDVLTNIDLA